MKLLIMLTFTLISVLALDRDGELSPVALIAELLRFVGKPKPRRPRPFKGSTP